MFMSHLCPSGAPVVHFINTKSATWLTTSVSQKFDLMFCLIKVILDYFVLHFGKLNFAKFALRWTKIYQNPINDIIGCDHNEAKIVFKKNVTVSLQDFKWTYLNYHCCCSCRWVDKMKTSNFLLYLKHLLTSSHGVTMSTQTA